MNVATVISDQRTHVRRTTASNLAAASRAAELLSERMCLAGVVSPSLPITDEQLEPVVRLAEELVDEVTEIVRSCQLGYDASLAHCLADARARAARAWDEAEAAGDERHDAVSA